MPSLTKLLAPFLELRILAIFLIWLFHGSAVIGISMGHGEWFASKTPLNLLLCLLWFALCYPMDRGSRWAYFGLFAVLGLAAEWAGVHLGWPFGTYAYGPNLGPKIGGVPWLIGAYWALLTFVTARIAGHFALPTAIKPFVGAGLMLLLDIFLERSAPDFGFWAFEGKVPLDNYLAWFAIGTLFQWILPASHKRGDLSIAANIYIAQLAFFTYFAAYPLG